MKDDPLDATDLTWLAGLARALLHDAASADDLVQETLVAALERPPATGQPTAEQAPAPPRAWLAAVARRLAARRYRAEARRRRREEHAAREEALPGAAELAARAEIAEQVTGAARRLPEPFRRTILLRFLEGKSPEEIARAEGKPVDTVRRRQRRALALLREELVRRHERDWSSWSVLLIPLTRPSGGAGLASAGASGTLVGTLAFATLVKATLVSVVLLLSGAALWLGWPGTSSAARDTVELGAAAPGPSASATDRARLQPDLTVPPRGVRSAADTQPETPSASAARPAGPLDSTTASDEPIALQGRVVNERDRPVVGASVYLTYGVPDETPSRAEPEPRARTTTDIRGRFQFLESDLQDATRDPEWALGVVANGFVRTHVERVFERYAAKLDPLTFAAEPTEGAGGQPGILVRINRGQPIVGRVVDASGWPVPGLELIAVTAGAGVAHGSPSQMQLRSERSKLARVGSNYHQSLGRTDEGGTVTFNGLPRDETFEVMSLDPGWTLDPAPRAAAGTGGESGDWLAQRCLGVVLTVLDPETQAPVKFAEASFRIRLTELDGTEHDTGQWVGRGAGRVSLTLSPSSLGDLSSKTFRGVTFYGKAGDGTYGVDWQSETLEDENGVAGVASATVTLRRATSARSAPEAESRAESQVPTGRITLDVRFDDDTPFEGRLVVGWRSRAADRPAMEGRARPTTTTPGRYRVEVPAGDVELRVSEYAASGSLQPWTGRVSCEPTGYATAIVTLPRGATVVLLRPPGWKGEWCVHASYRLDPADDWFGSWNYSTRADEHPLSSLRPAEWRFLLRRFPEDPDPLERIVVVQPGTVQRVD